MSKLYIYRGFQIKVITEAKQSLSDLKQVLRLINSYDHNYSYIDDYTKYKQVVAKNDGIKKDLAALNVAKYIYFDHIVIT